MTLRITYLHQYFNTPAQSGGTRSYEMARRLVARGHQVTMITSDRSDRGGSVREETIDGIRVLWIPVAYDNSMSYSRRMAAFAAFAIQSARLATLQPSDVIYATSTPLTIAIPAMYAARRRHVPWVLEVRDLWPEVPIAVGALRNPLAKAAAVWLARRAYTSARHIVALSPGMKEGIVALGAPDAKITVIPNCSDLERFDPSRADPQRFLVHHPQFAGRRLAMYAGQLGKINGLEYVVDMAAETSRTMAELAFILMGSGSERARLESYARSRNVLGKSLFVLSPEPKEEMPHAFAATDMALGIFRDLPYMDTNSSNKFFDALAAGKPVAINYGGWQAELVRQRDSGVLLCPSSAALGAASLVSKIRDAEFMRRSGIANLQMARENFSVDTAAKRLGELLEHVGATDSGH